MESVVRGEEEGESVYVDCHVQIGAVHQGEQRGLRFSGRRGYG